MENHFNFIKSPEITALNHSLDLLPGIIQVDLIVKNDTKNEFEIFRLKDRPGEIIRLNFSKTQKNDSLNFFKNQSGISWYQKGELPHIDNFNNKTDSDIFSELNKNILSIPLFSISEQRDVVFVFFFRKNASELGPVSADSVLDTSQKQILGRLISNSLKAMMHSIDENRKVMLEYNQMLNHIIQSKDQKIRNQSEEKSNYKKYLNEILNTYLNELQLKGEEFIIHEDVQEKLYPYLSNPIYLKKVLSKAVNFAKTFNFMMPTNKIELLPEYFTNLEPSKALEKQEIDDSQDIYSSHTKTYQFLESLESSAKRLLQKGDKLTSTNVGRELEHPVTAAAISDKLKNHAYKIHLLLQQFPKKWLLIRNQFRPIINIIEKQSKERYAS